MSTRRLLGVFAHPDDEVLISGALLHYHSLNVEKGLVYATRGESGTIANPALATPENLGQVREQEMRAAAEVLHVNQLWFLGYRDSGMAGSAPHQDPHAFIHARPAKVIGELVAIIRQFRPQVLITFDETGGYWQHPDHIAIYKYATGAFHAAADGVQYPELGPSHAISKLYYASLARRQIVTMTEWLEDQAYEGFVRDLDVEQMGFTDEQVNVVLDVDRWQETKALAWSKHCTQRNSNPIVSLLPQEMQRKLRSTEYYQLVATRVGPDTVGDNDLFAHVQA
jgi:LmbE family N-acetylglucosaminyl deacetylase